MRISFFVSLLLFGLMSCSKDPIKSNQVGNSNLTDTTLTNVSYGNDSSQVYDIYLPKGRDNSTPVILMIHGGAWKAGQKEDLNAYVNLIKSKWDKVAIVNINYRLASNTKNIHHHEIMADIDSVIGKVLRNQNNYHISNKMGIMGASAGGHLAMIYAYKYNSYQNIHCVGNFFGPSNLRDWSWYDSNNIWLGAYVGDILTEYVGQPWDTTAYKNASPYWNITNGSQPTIIFHGNLDPVVPLYQSQYLNNKLASLNVTHQYYEYIAFHGFDSTQSYDAISKMVAFFKTYLE